jgi:hypothetical protein
MRGVEKNPHRPALEPVIELSKLLPLDYALAVPRHPDSTRE